MSSNTMSFALPESLRAYIDRRVETGHYGNTSEYLRDLIRRDQLEQAKLRFRALIAEGLESGAGPLFDDHYITDLHARAFAHAE